MNDEDKLLVFISWSKALSREVALALRELVILIFDPVVIPWMSDQDIELGARGMNEIGESLDRSSFGIIVVTQANQQSQWINFEAGALSKKVGDPAVSVLPLLIDFGSTADLSGPLAQFQATMYGKLELLRVMRAIGIRAGVSTATIEQRFESAWGDFNAAVQSALASHPHEADTTHLRDADDKTDEMLKLVRELYREVRTSKSSSPTLIDTEPAKLSESKRVMEFVEELLAHSGMEASHVRVTGQIIAVQLKTPRDESQIRHLALNVRKAFPSYWVDVRLPD